MVEKINNRIRDRKNIFWSLTVGVSASLCCYLFFVSQTVRSVFLRQETERAIAKLESDTDNLETEYLHLKSNITSDLARAKGFKDIASSAKFISRNPLGKALSLNNEI